MRVIERIVTVLLDYGFVWSRRNAVCEFDSIATTQQERLVTETPELYCVWFAYRAERGGPAPGTR
jgi:hypothetical protein